MKKARIPALLLIVIFVSGVFFHASYDSFAEMKVFTPHPKTAYAKKFIALCENQKWYINEIERLLNLVISSVIRLFRDNFSFSSNVLKAAFHSAISTANFCVIVSFFAALSNVSF